LRDVLSKIRDEAIDVYARPFWEDPARLRKAVEDCYREEAVAQAKEALDESLRQARSAFDAGDYDRALKIYGPIDRSALAKSDLKRVELAKRKLGRNP
jgi:hypothetical protein